MIKNKFLLAFIILTSNSVFLESSNLVIKNAEIYDGIENNSYKGHILINDGVITKIGIICSPSKPSAYIPIIKPNKAKVIDVSIKKNIMRRG
jgi:adenine deaminase